MGQNAHRKFKEFKKKEELAKKYPNSEDRQYEARIAELEYKLQDKQDDEEYNRTNRLFDSINGND